jgi:hypothetical protein
MFCERRCNMYGTEALGSSSAAPNTPMNLTVACGARRLSAWR